jgi:periplasmic protein TonB
MARRLFDNLLESGLAGRRTKKRAISLPVSIGIHVTVLTAVILVPILLSGRDLPEPALGAVSAFFVEPAPPPPPPPPPPPAAAKPKEVTPPKVVQPTPAPVEEPKFTAPVETPKEEPKTQAMDFGVENGVDEGVTGGVQGGTVGGVEGGTVGGVQGGTLGGTPGGGQGGIGDAPAPPAPPAPPTAPVRVGGKISEPKKTHNVAPAYPEMAKRARVQGTVILEATISPQGKVTDVKVLRGIPMLDEAALSAVRQWTYTPTMLNGVPVPVIMSVTVNFKLDGSGGGAPSVSAAPKKEEKAAKEQPKQEPAPAAAAPAPQAPAPAAQAPAPAPAAPAPPAAAPPPAAPPSQPPAAQPTPEPTPPPGR